MSEVVEQKPIRFMAGMGTLQFLEAMQTGFLELDQDYVHSTPDGQNHFLHLYQHKSGNADTVASCAHLNSMHAHGRKLFGFAFDYAKTDSLIQYWHEYHAQEVRPRKIRRLLYDFQAECKLHHIPEDKLLAYLNLVKLTFRGFIVEFKPSVVEQLVIENESDLHQRNSQRFRFMSGKIPFHVIASYSGIGLLEDKFTRNYYNLLDHYRRSLAQIKSKPAEEQGPLKQKMLKEFYLRQGSLIHEVKQNIQKPYMIKYE